jgi:hypothetical protein
MRKKAGETPEARRRAYKTKRRRRLKRQATSRGEKEGTPW